MSQALESTIVARPQAIQKSRVAIAYLALTAPAWLIALDTAASYLVGWRFESRADAATFLAACAWLAVVTTALGLPTFRSALARRAAQVAALVAGLALAWLVAELAVGAILPNFDEPFHGRSPGLKFVYRPSPDLMRDVGAKADVAINSWGIRGSEPPVREAAYRILCLGGSTTACTYLDDTKTWPALLEHDLRAAEPSRGVWVGNAGMPSYRSHEHRKFVETSPRMGEIDCLLLQTGVNDLSNVLTGPRPRKPWWLRTNLWQLFANVRRQLAGPEAFIETSDGSVYARRRQMRQAAVIEQNEPDLGPGLSDFSDNVRAIVRECQKRRVRVVFTTQPVLWSAELDAENRDLLWFGRMSDDRYLSVERLRDAIDRYNETLAEVCRDCGVELIDLSRLNGDPAVFYDDCHFTETGARRVAELVAQWFVEHPAPVPQPAPR